MIHTFEISYELSLKDANTCTYRLNERTRAFEGFQVRDFLDTTREKFEYLVFVLPDLTGIRTIRVTKYKDRNKNLIFRIYLIIEAEVLRTGTETLDLFFCSPAHAKELQSQYAKAIYNLFPEAFTGRPAVSLYTSDFAPRESYTEEEFQLHSGLYSLPYLWLASVKRIDFTFDVKVSSQEEAELFTYMVQQTYYDSWKVKETKGKSKNPDSEDKCYDKAFESGSRRFSVYDKYNKMQDKEYDSRLNIEQIREAARNVVRIEVPVFSPGRETIKSLTWLHIPDDAIPLGLLPYLATEQVSSNIFRQEYIEHIGNAYELKWYKRGKLHTRLKRLVRQHRITENAETMIKKISQAIAQGRSLKTAVEAFKEHGKITLHRKRNKNKEPVREEFECNIAQYRRYRNLAMKNGLMLVTIPDSRKISELPVNTVLRKFDCIAGGSQLIIRMHPYQPVSEIIPELEPVKALYDAILSFLYGKYDQYAADHNTKMEAMMIPADNIEQ